MNCPYCGQHVKARNGGVMAHIRTYHWDKLRILSRLPIPDTAKATRIATKAGLKRCKAHHCWYIPSQGCESCAKAQKTRQMRKRAREHVL